MTMQDPAVDEVENTRRRLMEAMRTGAAQDPTALARDRQEAERRGVSVQTLRAARAAGLPLPNANWNTLPERAPRTTTFLSNPANAAAAHDDVDTLANAEEVLRTPAGRQDQLDYYRRLNGGSMLTSAQRPNTFGNWMRGLGTGFVQGVEQTRIGLTMQIGDLVDSIIPVENQPEWMRTSTDQYGRSRTIYDYRQSQGARDLARPDVDGIAGGIYGGVESTIRSAPLLAAAIATRNPTIAVAGAGVQTQAESYGKYRERGGTAQEAFIGASGEGAVESATELLPLGFLVQRFGKDGAKAFIAGTLLREIPSEQAATLAQDAIDTAVANPDKTWAEYWAERPQAAADTAIATLTQTAIMGSASAGVNYAATRLDRDQQVTQEADRQGEVIDRLNALSEASPLRQRDPQTFQQFIDEAADGTDIEAVYVDAQTFAQSFNAESLTALTEAVPEIAEQLDGAIATGGDIRIPTGAFAAHIAGTEAAAPLLEHLKIDPFAQSRAEAREFLKTQGEELRAEIEAAAAAGQMDEAFVASKDVVRDRVASELDTVGRFSSDVNRAYATVLSDFYAVQAANLGITPEQMAERYPLKFSGELPGGQGRTTLDQTEELDLVHFSGLPGLAESDPSRWGANRTATTREEANRKAMGAPGRTYFGVRGGYNPEGVIRMTSPFEYSARVPAARVYDFDADPQGLRPEGEQNAETASAYEAAIQAAGFGGYRSAQLGGVVAMFEPTPLEMTGAVQTVEEARAVDARMRELQREERAARVRANPNEMVTAQPLENFRAQAMADVMPDRVFGQSAITPDQADAKARKLAEEIPGLKGVLPYLSTDEKAKLRRDTATKITKMIEDFPDAEEMAAVAYSGRAKRGWYENSAQAILSIFGAADAPRFAALLAALSPQTSVEANAFNALATWTNWINAGRPQDQKTILRIMGESVQGKGTEESVLNAWVNNSVTALTTENPGDITLSGPKVNSFMMNLVGVVDEVTNDAWMANYALVEQSVFKKTGAVPGKGSGYMAMNAVARRAAEIVSEKTGDDWTAAEVQETVWSWAKTLYEMRDSAGEKRTAPEILAAGGLTAEDIASTPDFAVLFVDGVFRRILEAGGYGAELDALDARGQPARRDGGGSLDPGSVEGTGFDEGDFTRYVDQAAARLEELRTRRQAAAQAKPDQLSLFAQGPIAEELPLEGQPQVVNIPGRGRTRFGLFAKARLVAREYMRGRGWPYSPPTVYAKVDEARAKRIADAFEAMKHNPNDPQVAEAYRLMIDETLAQWQAIKATGLKVEFIRGEDPYAATPRLAILDVVENNHLWVFPTDDGFGSSELDVSDNPLLELTDEYIDGVQLRANDVFRIVHDYFGHIKDGNGFRADGEENAWQSHAAMYSPLARRAMTTETRGQNSWVNFGPKAEFNRTASASETVYADQKIGLLPEWVSTEGFLGEGPAGTYAQSPTETEAFKAWFGDSKVVDAKGEPLVVYHGTPGPAFDTFDPERPGITSVLWSAAETQRQGFYFTADQDFARAFADQNRAQGRGTVLPVYLSIQNPLDVRTTANVAVDAMKAVAARAAEIDPSITNPEFIWGQTGGDRFWEVLDDEQGGAAVVQALRELGYDGLRMIEEGLEGKDADVWVAFDNTQMKSTDNLGAFDPSDPNMMNQDNRGQIAFGADITQTPSVISVLRTADLSTFLHETGHFFLEVTTHIANQADAPAGIKADMGAVFSWFGEGMDLARWNTMTTEERRPYHEQFARGFEAYLFEGRAPSPALRSLFRRFSAWLKNVYKSLTALNVELTDEVRSVFDRMLASADDIRVAEQARSFAPMMTEKPETMSADEWKRYQELGIEATQEAIETLEQRNLRDMQWASNAKSRALRALQREANEQRKAVRAEVTAEVEAEPVNRARAFLRRGVNAEGEQVEGAAKLDIDTMRELYGEDGLWTGLKRGGKYGDAGNDGLHPDVVADMFGFANGESLIEALVNGPNPRDQIIGMTDQRMLERYGDLSTPEALERAANEAVANDARLKFLSAEGAALDKAVGRRSILNEAAREYAASVVNRLMLKRLRPAQYLAAQGRAAKAAEQAFRKGDLAAAATAKRNQLVNLHTGRAVQKAQREVEKSMRLFKRIVTANNDALSKSRNMDLVNAARAVLMAHGMGRVKNNAAGYMEAVSKYDPTLFADLNPLVLGATANALPMENITYEQFVALRDTVSSLWELAKRSRQIEVDGKLVDISVATAAMTERMDAIKPVSEQPGQARAVTDAQERDRDLLGARAALRRVESWARGLDGADKGPFRTYIWSMISRAADQYRAESNVYIRRFRELLDTVRADLKPKDIPAPEIGYVFGGKSELYHALLHTGNGSNKSKLLLGRKWGRKLEDGSLDDTRWQAFIDRLHTEGVLTQKDWTFVQAVWDLMEETKPGAQKAHRQVYGRYFDEIAADPVDTPFGQLRGGYVPAMTDAFMVQDAALRAEQEAIEGGDSAMFPAASNGFTKSRVEDYTRELALDLRLLPMHIDKVLKFTHLGPPVRDVMRVLKNRAFSARLSAFDPTAQTDLLLPWLQRAAKQIVQTPTKGRAGKGVDRFFNALRARVGMQLMFGNVLNTAQQLLTGWAPAMLRVGKGPMSASLWRFMRAPDEYSKQATNLSVFLKNRAQTDVFEARQQIAQLTKLNPNAKDQFVDFVTRHTYFMQTAVQNVMDVVIWGAAYDQATQRGDSQDDAVRFADSVIRETQGSMSPEDISRFETGTPFVRMFTQFAGYFNLMANLNATEVQIVARGVGLKQGMGRLWYVYLMGFAIPALIGDAVMQIGRGGWDDEDEDGYTDDLFAWFFSSQAKFALAAVPVVGQAANAALATFNDKPYDDRISMSPAVSVIEGGLKTPSEAYQTLVEGESFNQSDTRNALNLLGILTGTPTGALAKPVGYGAGVAAGDVEPTGPVDAVRGAVTGAASPASKQ